MSSNSSIEWTEATWNPTTGCTKISSGCLHCYIERTPPFRMAGRRFDKKGHIPLIIHEDRLDTPLHWKKPRRVFVNSLSDLFHKDVPFEFVDKVFAVMALTPQHTYQILTKRPERMAEYTNQVYIPGAFCDAAISHFKKLLHSTEFKEHGNGAYKKLVGPPWPLPNVWLGTSCENQETADERIPHLLRCPAAVRFLSCEPLLDSIWFNPPTNLSHNWGATLEGIDWCIVGGESGPGARSCNIAWVRSIVAQCKTAGVACFVKQLGARIELPNDSSMEWPRQGDEWIELNPDIPVSYQGELMEIRLEDAKGGDINEFPADLRVRQFPAPAQKAQAVP